MIRRLITLGALLPMTAFMAACTVDSDESTSPVTETSFKARFNPAAALIPFPNDIWRGGSTDGTLNIYQGSERFESDPLIGQVEQLNLLDGFGLNSPIYVDFNEPLDETTLALGQTVFVFSVATAGNPHTPAMVTTFDVGTADFQGGRTVLELTPTAPLSPLTTYAVILTNGIESSAGETATADQAFQAMLAAHAAGAGTVGDDATLTAVYNRVVKNALTLADGITGVGSENTIAAWTFTTQSVGQSLGLIQSMATDPQLSAFIPLLRNPNDVNEGIYTAGELLLAAGRNDADEDGIPDTGLNADVYAGVIELPYYLAEDELLDGYWEPVEASCQAAIDNEELDVDEPSASTTVFCPLPQVKQTVTVPVLLTIPNAHADNAGCDAGSGVEINGVTIFQHGITQDRTNVLAVAGTLAQACQATIAIDLPLHGIVDTAHDLYAPAISNPAESTSLYASLAGLEPLAPGVTEAIANLTEQTFDLDVNEDDAIDGSGEHFINLASPITARDSLRQATANLIHLTATIPSIDYDMALAAQGVPGTDIGADFELLPISYVGMSLGGIAGVPFLALNDDVGPAVLSVSGGLITNLLRESASIFPEVEQGLADQGLVSGMRFFEEFFRNAQTLVDGGDAINYAAAASANHNILLMAVVGGGDILPDQVVPNSSTEALADAMGLEQITATTVDNANGVSGFVRFVAGDHGSLLNPAASSDATIEMQTEMAVFIGGHPALGGGILPGGHGIVIVNPLVVDTD